MMTVYGDLDYEYYGMQTTIVYSQIMTKVNTIFTM
jgi:hypothetical protein